MNKIAISNFKSIGEKELELDLKPITILVGPNGAGKSNILEAIALLSQSINTDLKPKGDLIQYPNNSYFLHRNDPNNKIGFRLFSSYHGKPVEYWYVRDFGSENLNLQCVSIGKRDTCVSTLFIKENNIYEYRIESNYFGGEIVSRENPVMLLNKNVFVCGDYKIYKLLEPSREVINHFENLLSNVFLISVGRGNIPFNTEVVPKPRWVGKYGEYLIPVLTYLFNNQECFPIRDKIIKWADIFGLKNLLSGWRGGKILSSSFKDDAFDIDLNLSLAGFGSKQIISIITQLFYSPKNSILLLEEPEISLHPRQQALLPELFSAGIKEGKKIVLTTHSEFLLLSPQISIKKGLLTSDDIAIYHITKEEEGTIATPLEISKEGFIKNWVPTFADVEINLFKEWFDTIPEEG